MIAPLSPIARLRASLAAVPPARWRAIFLLALATVVMVAGFRYAAKIEKASVLGTQTRSAFLRWRAQIVGDTWPDGRPIPGLKQGADPYWLYNYPNPPIMALVLWPFFELPPTTGALVWFFLKAGMAAIAVVWAFRLVEGTGPSIPDGAKAAAVLLGLHPILGDLSHGNVNIFIAFLVLGGLELFRRRLDVAAGLVLGLAVACKVTPALLFPYLVWKRAWRASAALLVGVGLWLVVVPGSVLGWERNVTLLHNWFDGMVRPFLIDGKVTSEHANQSIPGLTARLLTAQPSEFDWTEDGTQFGKEYHNLTDIGPAVLLCRAPIGQGGGRQGVWFAAEVAFVFLGMLLFSERTWKHHAVTLVVPYAVLTAVMASESVCRETRRYLLCTLASVGVLAFGPSLVGGDAQDTALVYGSHTAMFLLLATAVCVVMWRSKANRRDGSLSEPLSPGSSTAFPAPCRLG
jgi:alpha-1,2-mannosyltransferase